MRSRQETDEQAFGRINASKCYAANLRNTATLDIRKTHKQKNSKINFLKSDKLNSPGFLGTNQSDNDKLESQVDDIERKKLMDGLVVVWDLNDIQKFHRKYFKTYAMQVKKRKKLYQIIHHELESTENNKSFYQEVMKNIGKRQILYLEILKKIEESQNHTNYQNRPKLIKDIVLMLGALREYTIETIESIIIWSGFFVYCNSETETPEDLSEELFNFKYNDENYIHTLLNEMED